MSAPTALHLAIRNQVDVERARRETRALARQLGFDRAGAESVVLAVSELGTNLARYATTGRINVRPLVRPESVGIEVTSEDDGPGIVDPQGALRQEFSTSSGLGAGLAGVQRLMDDFRLRTGPTGTNVVCRKWRNRP